jgi:hypothetical protein
MKHLWTIAALTPLILSPACIDYATFVTATNIGISADTTTQDVNIGYTRTELFTGPGYPEQGEVPRAVGFINSDLHVFAPHIQQLYATGEAAEVVTFPGTPTPPDKLPTEPPSYSGQRRPLVFGTGSNVGLNVKFSAATGPAPSSIKFGYNREELSIIPMRSEVPTNKQNPDKYAPVLASIDMNLGGVAQANADTGSTQPNSVTSIQANTNLGLRQFFATGSAARNLAYRPEIRDLFKGEAAEAVKSAAPSGTYTYNDLSKKIEAVWMPDGRSVDPAGQKRIQDCMTKNAISGNIYEIINTKSNSDKSKVVTCLHV